MPSVVGVVFQSGGKVYHFDPGALELDRGDHVVVQTMRGTEIGSVVEPPHEIGEDELPAPLKRVVRLATPKDRETVAANESLRQEALSTCRKMVAQHGLQMKVVDAEMVFGGGKVTFTFYSEERVDFRALVVDLARALKMRIELRQIGVRDEARILGGLGPCGRPFCCTLFQVDQEPVSIRMAKEQNLPLNPMKISGLCGRLMCCLKYEQEQYVLFRKEAPRRGTLVQTAKGPATVIGYQVPKDSLTVRLEEGGVVDFPIGECTCPGGDSCGSGGTCAAAHAAPVAPGEAIKVAGAEEGTGLPTAAPAEQYLALTTVEEEPDADGPQAADQDASRSGSDEAEAGGETSGSEPGVEGSVDGVSDKVTHGSPVPRHARPRRRRRRSQNPGAQVGSAGQSQGGEGASGGGGGGRRHRSPKQGTDGPKADSGHA